MKNFFTGNIMSDEWYTPLNVVKFIECLSNIIDFKKQKIICPYDTNKSNFVKIFPNSIYNITDFLEKDYDYDICITNPPFSIKYQVLEKILKDNKNAILIFPETAIFSVTFYNLIKKYNFYYRIYSPKQRIYFYDEKGNQNRPNFHSVILQIDKYFNYNSIIHFDLDEKIKEINNYEQK